MHEAGINEFIFIVGYLGEKIQDYVKTQISRVTWHIYVHRMKAGNRACIRLTKDIVDDDEVFIVLGDTICEYDV